MPFDASSPDGDSNIRLNSWKEIAAYLRCGVRTVQRWEKSEGLPVQARASGPRTHLCFTTDWRSQRSSATLNAESFAGQLKPSRSPIVGRLSELARLQAYWRTALAGPRQVVFVSGTIGVGKTALVRAFLDRVKSAWVIQGDSVEQYGAGEPYLPSKRLDPRKLYVKRQAKSLSHKSSSSTHPAASQVMCDVGQSSVGTTLGAAVLKPHGSLRVATEESR